MAKVDRVIAGNFFKIDVVGHISFSCLLNVDNQGLLEQYTTASIRSSKSHNPQTRVVIYHRYDPPSDTGLLPYIVLFLTQIGSFV